MQHAAVYPCPTCWESIEITVDPSAGREQQYVEDGPEGAFSTPRSVPPGRKIDWPAIEAAREGLGPRRNGT